ncbi:hypothetical protein [Salmon gill poxvirus]
MAAVQACLNICGNLKKNTDFSTVSTVIFYTEHTWALAFVNTLSKVKNKGYKPINSMSKGSSRVIKGIGKDDKDVLLIKSVDTIDFDSFNLFIDTLSGLRQIIIMIHYTKENTLNIKYPDITEIIIHRNTLNEFSTLMPGEVKDTSDIYFQNKNEWNLLEHFSDKPQTFIENITANLAKTCVDKSDLWKACMLYTLSTGLDLIYNNALIEHDAIQLGNHTKWGGFLPKIETRPRKEPNFTSVVLASCIEMINTVYDSDLTFDNVFSFDYPVIDDRTKTLSDKMVRHMVTLLIVAMRDVSDKMLTVFFNSNTMLNIKMISSPDHWKILKNLDNYV